MASYTYLTLATEPELSENSDSIPTTDNAPYFEGKYGIPIFWLCLFSSAHLKTVRESREYGEESITADYPYLIAPQKEALENGRKRREQLSLILNDRQLLLYDDFLERIRNEFSPYILVLTDDVADMDGPEEYLPHIRIALETMEKNPPQQWVHNFSFENVSTLSPNIRENTAYTLVGYDNTSHWPPTSLPPVEDPKADIAEGSASDEATTERIAAPSEPPTSAHSKSKKALAQAKAQEEEKALDEWADLLIPERFHIPLEGVSAQELLYTIQVALAVQKSSAIAHSSKGQEEARSFLSALAKRSHISHGDNSKFLSFDRSSKAKYWGYLNIGAMVSGLVCLIITLFFSYFWAIGVVVSIAFWFFVPDPTITAFEYSKGTLRRGFKKIPLSEITLAHFTLSGKDGHLWASLNIFPGKPIHVIVLSGPMREKYMLAFFCALWKMIFPAK